MIMIQIIVYNPLYLYRYVYSTDLEHTKTEDIVKDVRWATDQKGPAWHVFTGLGSLGQCRWRGGGGPGAVQTFLGGRKGSWSSDSVMDLGQVVLEVVCCAHTG